MRLLSRVEGLQKRRQGRETEAEAISVAWSSDERRLPLEWEPGPDEHVALDTYELQEPEGEAPVRIRTVERVATMPGDLGVYYDAEGAAIGRVVAVTRSGLVRIAFDEGVSRGGGQGA